MGAPAHRARLHQLLTRFGDEVRETHRGWAKAAGALVGAGDHAAAATWAADWQARKPDEPWMLHPVAVALRQLGRVEEARQVTVYAIDLPAEDPTTTDFRVWLAFEAALEGRPDRAERLLADTDEDDLDDVPRVLHALTVALVSVQRKGRQAFVGARDRGQAAVRQYAPKAGDADLALSYRRWAKRLARDAGGFGAWVWAVFKGGTLPGG
jgi:Flp pilus assembly protein TadD